MKIALKPESCWVSCNRHKYDDYWKDNKDWDCWLEWYPEHRCKYRLTLPKEDDKII
jgi:hypothetical protein